MRKLKVTVFSTYEVEIDDNNEIVKEYKKNGNELINDCLSCGFSNALPVIKSGGVKSDLIDCEIDSIIELKP